MRESNAIFSERIEKKPEYISNYWIFYGISVIFIERIENPWIKSLNSLEKIENTLKQCNYLGNW